MKIATLKVCFAQRSSMTYPQGQYRVRGSKSLTGVTLLEIMENQLFLEDFMVIPTQGHAILVPMITEWECIEYRS